ncbi:MAG: hypothetical protein ACOVP8_06970, partial [Phycisphaerales bacterium]
VGVVYGSNGARATVWNGTPASAVNLHPPRPAPYIDSHAFAVHNGKQVGYATTGQGPHAMLWSNTAASFVDLHELLPVDSFSNSYATGVWTDGSTIIVSGYGLANSVFADRAIVWTFAPDAPACDDIDFNNNGVFPEDQDVIDFFNVLSGSACGTCSDIDFNNNDVFPEDQDVIDFFAVLAGGNCV